MNPFENARAGDAVLVRKNAGFKSFLVKSTIEKVTKTEITVDGRRFKKANGRAVGISSWDVGSVYPYSKEKDRTAAYLEQFLKLSAANCAKLIAQNSNDLSAEDARLIIDIWKRIKKPDGGAV